jgi:hypothetical protein
MMLASQLPESQADALLVLVAVRELVETFMASGAPKAAEVASNVLPFVSG